jgi:uncharacterized protein YndB with AHSA1/START domain
MTSTDEAAPVVMVQRHFAVPRERVFQAWLDSESLAHWMAPRSAGFTHATVAVDPRVGGGFRIVMEGRPEGGVEHYGDYLAIEPPSLLSFTWISRNTDDRPTVVTVEFRERGTGTDVVLTHRGLPARSVEGHRRGWTELLGALDEALTG